MSKPQIDCEMKVRTSNSPVLVEVILFLYFFSRYFHQKERTKVYQYLYIAAYGVLLFCSSYYMPASFVRSAFNTILTFSAAKLFLKTTWKKIFYPTFLFIITAIFSDVLCGAILNMSGLSYNDIMGVGAGRIIYNSMAKLVQLILFYAILLFMKNRDVNLKTNHALPLLSCHVLSFFICYQNFISMAHGSTGYMIILESLALLYINIVICAYVEILSRSYLRQQEAVLARQQLKIREDYYQDLVARQEETRVLWHDIKKYMAAMESLVGQENKGEARQCLEAVHASFTPIKNSIDTGNSLIDSILTYGIKKAAAVGVTITPEIWVDSTLNIPAPDLFIIIGNTMDNAIEASSLLEETENKDIKISLYQRNHVLLYEISNAYRCEKSKKPGKIHGYGLQNVHTCVDRNEGSMSITTTDKLYNVSICLNV